MNEFVGKLIPEGPLWSPEEFEKQIRGFRICPASTFSVVPLHLGQTHLTHNIRTREVKIDESL